MAFMNVFENTYMKVKSLKGKELVVFVITITFVSLRNSVLKLFLNFQQFLDPKDLKRWLCQEGRKEGR